MLTDDLLNELLKLPWEHEEYEQPIRQVQRLKTILIDRARNQQPDEREFVWFRERLIANQDLKPLLPPFLSDCRTLDTFWNFISDRYSGDGSHRKRSEFIETQFKSILDHLEGLTPSPVDGAIETLLTVVTQANVKRAWEKCIERRKTDPDGAVTMAQALLATVCKHILEEAQVGYDKNEQVTGLVNKALETLGLLPEHLGNPWVKQIGQGCKCISVGVFELYRTDSDTKGVGPEHELISPLFAEFAVNASMILAAFLLAVWEKQ